MANTRKPNNANGTFDLDAYIAENAKPAYEFPFAGRTWRMENLNELDAWKLLAAADSGETEATMTIMREAFGEEDFEEFRKHRLPQHALMELFNRYREFCGVEAGDSPASTNSSPNTGRR